MFISNLFVSKNARGVCVFIAMVAVALVPKGAVTPDKRAGIFSVGKKTELPQCDTSSRIPLWPLSSITTEVKVIS